MRRKNPGLSRKVVVVLLSMNVELSPGDVVSCPPGELHTHGAAGDSHFSHLTVTTGGYTFPGPDRAVQAQGEADD